MMAAESGQEVNGPVSMSEDPSDPSTQSGSSLADFSHESPSQSSAAFSESVDTAGESSKSETKSTDAATGPRASKVRKRRRKRVKGEEADSNAVPAKKKKRKKKEVELEAKTCSTQKKEDNGNMSVWSQLGAFKCDKCGITLTEQGLFNNHSCNGKQYKKMLPKTDLPVQSTQRLVAMCIVLPDSSSSQSKVCSAETNCTPAPVTRSSEPPSSALPSSEPDRKHAEPPQATVCSAETNSTASLSRSSESDTKHAEPPQAIACSSETNCTPLPLSRSSEPNTRRAEPPQTTAQLNTLGAENSQQRQGFILYDKSTNCFSCMQCTYRAQEGNSLIEHLIYQISPNPYNCQICKTGLATRAAFQKHFTDNHRGKKIECELRHVKEVKKILLKAKEAAVSGETQAFLLHSEFKNCIRTSSARARPKTASLPQSTPVSRNSCLKMPTSSTALCSQTIASEASAGQNPTVDRSEESAAANQVADSPVSHSQVCSVSTASDPATVSSVSVDFHSSGSKRASQVPSTVDSVVPIEAQCHPAASESEGTLTGHSSVTSVASSQIRAELTEHVHQSSQLHRFKSADSSPLLDTFCSVGSRNSPASVPVQHISSLQPVQALHESEISQDQQDSREPAQCSSEDLTGRHSHSPTQGVSQSSHEVDSHQSSDCHVPVSSLENAASDSVDSGQHSCHASEASAEHTEASQQQELIDTSPNSVGPRVNQGKRETHVGLRVQPSVDESMQDHALSTHPSQTCDKTGLNMLEHEQAVEHPIPASSREAVDVSGSVPDEPSGDSARCLPQPVEKVEAGATLPGPYSPISSFSSGSISSTFSTGSMPSSPLPNSSDQTDSAVVPPCSSPPPIAVAPVGLPPAIVTSVSRPSAALSPVTPVNSPPASVSPGLRPSAALSPVTPVNSPPAAFSPGLRLSAALSPVTSVSSLPAIFSPTTPPHVLRPSATFSPVTPVGSPPTSVSPGLWPYAALSPVTPVNSPPASVSLGLRPYAALSPITPVNSPPAAATLVTPVSSSSAVLSSVMSPPAHMLPAAVAGPVPSLDLSVPEQEGEELVVSSPAVHRPLNAAFFPQPRGGSSTGMDCRSAQALGSVSVPAESEENCGPTSTVAATHAPSSVQSLSSLSLPSSSYFVMYKNKYVCLPCKTKMADKDTFYNHVWQHLHADGRCCNKCKNFTEKWCVQTSEMVDSASSDADGKLIYNLDDDCRRKYMPKLVGGHSSPLCEREAESPVFTTYIGGQLSGSSVHPNNQTVQNVQNDSTISSESRQESEVPQTTQSQCPATGDACPSLDCNAGTGGNEGVAVDHAEQSSRNSPALLPAASENEVEEERGLADGQKSMNWASDQEHSEQISRDVHLEDESCCNPSSRSENISPTGDEPREENGPRADCDNVGGGEAEAEADLEGDASLALGHAVPHLGLGLTSQGADRNFEKASTQELPANSTTRLSEGSRMNRNNSLDTERETGTDSSDRSTFFYICTLCDYSCATALDFTMHLNSDHHSESVFPCYHCNYHGIYNTDLTNHMSAHTAGDSNIYLCPCKCVYSTDSLHSLRQHLQNHKDCSIFRCSRCCTTFQDSMEFILHAQLNSITLYTCSQCASRFLEKSAIQQHWRMEHTGGLVVKVLKILLCGERKTNRYQGSTSGKGARRDSRNDSVESFQGAGSENADVSSIEKSATGAPISDAGDQSDVLVSVLEPPTNPVTEEEKEVHASEKQWEGPSPKELSKDTALDNVDNTCPEDVPESAEQMLDRRSEAAQNQASFVSASLDESRPQDENSKFVVLSIPDQDDSASFQLNTGGGCERKDDISEQNRSQSNHSERASESDQSVFTHVVIVDGQVTESKNMDCDQGSHQPLQGNVPDDQSTSLTGVTEVQAITSQPEHETAEVGENQDNAALEIPSEHALQRTLLSPELPHPESANLMPPETSARDVVPIPDPSENPAKDGQRMTKLTDLFGSSELHSVMSDQLYHKYEGQFRCGVCEKVFARLESIHEHLFTHFHVPLFSCFFCSFRSGLRRSLRRHVTENHPQEKCQVNCLMVHRDHLLQSLQKEKPLKIQDFKTICHQLKEVNKATGNTSASGHRVEKESQSTAGEKTEGVNQADDVKHTSAAIHTSLPSTAEYRDMSMKQHSTFGITGSSPGDSLGSGEAETIKETDIAGDGAAASVAHHVKSMNRSLTSRRKSGEEIVRSSGDHHENKVAQDSKKVHTLAAKPHSSQHYKQKPLQKNSEDKKCPPKLKNGTYTVVKVGAMIKLKCKACGDMTLSKSSMTKHLEKCKQSNTQPVSDQTDFAGALAKQMKQKNYGSASGSPFTLQSTKDDPAEAKGSGSVRSKSTARNLLDPLGSNAHSKVSDHSGKTRKRPSQKTPHSERNAQKLSSEHTKKPKPAEGLDETAVKETGPAKSAHDAASLGSDRSPQKSEKLKDDEGNQSLVETATVHVDTADNQSGDEMTEEDEEDDWPFRRPGKRKAARRLESSSDEDDSGGQNVPDGNVETENEGRTTTHSEEISQCKHCDFAAPSSQVNELQDHLHSKHQLLMSLIKCGYCDHLYGSLKFLKGHIDNTHLGKPELQEPVSYHQFFIIQEKENCSPKQQLQQQVDKVRSESQSKIRRVQSPIVISDEEVEESNGKGSQGKYESKNTDNGTGRAVSHTPNKTAAEVIPGDDGDTSAVSLSQTNNTVSENKNTMSSFQKDGISSQTIVGSGPQCQGQGRNLKRFPALESEEFRTLSSSKGTPEPRHVSTLSSDTVSDPETRSDSFVKADPSVSGQTETGPSAWEIRTKEGLSEERRSRVNEGEDKSCSKRYQCLKCNQAHSNYRSIFLHLSRHLDYSPFRCDLCSIEFFTENEAKTHHFRSHPTKSFSQSGVYDLEVEEDLTALVQASVVKGPDAPPQASMTPIFTLTPEERKQTIQCCLCRMVLDSLSLFKRHCIEDHQLKERAENMLWQDTSSQIVYDLNGQPIHGMTAAHYEGLDYLCAFCSWRFVNRKEVLHHAQETHVDKQLWVVHLRSFYTTGPKKTCANSYVPAARSQEKKSETPRGQTSSDPAWNISQSSPTTGEVLQDSKNPERETSSDMTRDRIQSSCPPRNLPPDSEQGSAVLSVSSDGKGPHSVTPMLEPQVVLTDFFRTDQILEFQDLLQSNGITSFYLGDSLSAEAQAFLMRFVPQ